MDPEAGGNDVATPVRTTPGATRHLRRSAAGIAAARATPASTASRGTPGSVASSAATHESGYRRRSGVAGVRPSRRDVQGQRVAPGLGGLGFGATNEVAGERGGAGPRRDDVEAHARPSPSLSTASDASTGLRTPVPRPPASTGGAATGGRERSVHWGPTSEHRAGGGADSGGGAAAAAGSSVSTASRRKAQRRLHTSFSGSGSDGGGGGSVDDSDADAPPGLDAESVKAIPSTQGPAFGGMFSLSRRQFGVAGASRAITRAPKGSQDKDDDSKGAAGLAPTPTEADRQRRLFALRREHDAEQRLADGRRRRHRRVAELLAVPLLFTAATGVAVSVVKFWKHASPEDSSAVVKVHNLAAIGLAFAFPVFVGMLLVHQAWTGFRMSELFNPGRDDQLRPRSARMWHFKLSVLALGPVALTASTGIAYQFCRSWLRMHKAHLMWLLRLHTLRVVGWQKGYTIVVAVLIVSMALSGWQMTTCFRRSQELAVDGWVRARKFCRWKTVRRAYKKWKRKRHRDGEP